MRASDVTTGSMLHVMLHAHIHPTCVCMCVFRVCSMPMLCVCMCVLRVYVPHVFCVHAVCVCVCFHVSVLSHVLPLLLARSLFADTLIGTTTEPAIRRTDRRTDCDCEDVETDGERWDVM